MDEICIQEHGLLVEGKTPTGHGLRLGGIVNPRAWKFLESLAISKDKNHRFLELAAFQGRKAFKVLNFVGVITTPDGTQIEILPKTTEEDQDPKMVREILWKMLCKAENLKYLETTRALLMLREQRLPEALISIFLDNTATLVRHGIRKDYERIEEEEPFLRGRLRLAQQLRQPLGRRHLFRIEYDVYSENRAENRLIHAALRQIIKWSRSERNQRLARELRGAFDRIPISNNHAVDLAQWRSGREMTHYHSVLPWVKYILNEESPFAIRDAHTGISFLFPMEKLFEKYVACALKDQLANIGLSTVQQVADRYLAMSPRAFQLKPDIGVYLEEKLVCILDTKWKLIDRQATYSNGDPDPKSGIKQSDVYQMYAYGRRYLNGFGTVAMIYPQWTRFAEPLMPFVLEDGLTLEVLPFDLVNDECVGLMTLLSRPY